MYLIFECGVCGTPYNIQVEKFTDTLQKVVCPTCQTTHFFGATQENIQSSEPTIEKMFQPSEKLVPVDPKLEKRGIDKEVFWKCGVCDSMYHFNLNRVTTSGIKITCNVCFNFFILQKVLTMVDMDHMIMQEVSPEKMSEPLAPNPKPHGVLPPMIEDNEVSGKFDIPKLNDELQKLEERERFGETSDDINVMSLSPVVPDLPKPIQTEKNKASSVAKNLELPLEISTGEEIIEEVTKPGDTIPPSKQVITAPPISDFTPPLPAPAPKAPAPKKAIPASPKFSIDIPVKKKNVSSIIKNADEELVNSFMSYNTTKANFKLNKEFDVPSLPFLEDSLKKPPNFFEKNMVKISIWIAGICALLLVVAVGIDMYQKKHKKPEEYIPMPVTSPDKPKYGFPEMSESPSTPDQSPQPAQPVQPTQPAK